jgi:ectoine hydroxylase-related dioxygenase (phytanoyl-CoA dioxygenase family)
LSVLEGKRFGEVMSIVTLSADERVTGRLTEENASQAYDHLDAEGFVVLRGCFTPYLVDEMYQEYQAQYGNFSVAEMADLARGPSSVMSVGHNRFEIVLRLTGAFDARIYANGVLLNFLSPLIGRDMRLSGVSAVAAYPGAERQHVHRDAGHLFADFRVGPTLPPYAINVAVPLIDVDHTIGPTAIWPGTHRHTDGMEVATGSPPTVHTFERGDAILTDYRTLHGGQPNMSQIVRPILYMVYARSWFFDDVNHVHRSPLDMPMETFAALPENLKPLLLRAYTQQIRARKLLNLA